MSSPVVSVVMPCYDAEAFVADAVRSVLAQSFADLELLVTDDGSTDGSLACLAPFASDARMRVLTLSHGGPGRARNAGLAAATGRIVAFLDADDRWEPGHLERLVGALDANPGRFVYTGGTSVGAEGPRPIHDAGYVPAATFRDLFVDVHIASPGAFAARRGDLLAVGGFPEDPAWIGSEDRALYLSLARAGVLPAYLPGGGLLYRRHLGQLTSRRATFLKAKLAVRAAFADATAGEPPVRLVPEAEARAVLGTVAYDLAYALLDVDLEESRSAYAQAISFDWEIARGTRAISYLRKRRRAWWKRVPIVGSLLSGARRAMRGRPAGSVSGPTA